MVTAKEACGLVLGAKLSAEEIAQIIKLIVMEEDATLPIFEGLSSDGVAAAVRGYLIGRSQAAYFKLNDVKLLQQALPEWQYRRVTGIHSDATTAYDCHPETVVPWDVTESGMSLDDSITQFTRSIPGRGEYHPPQPGRMCWFGTEEGPVYEFHRNVLNNVNTLSLRKDKPLLMQFGSSGGNSSSGGSSSNSSRNRFVWTTHMVSVALPQDVTSYIPQTDQKKKPDSVLIDEDSKQSYATVEVERPEVLAGVDDLVKAWKAGAHVISTDAAGCTAAKAANAISVLSQALAYMSCNGHVYGCITTYDYTWLLQCTEGNTLRVSRRFKLTDTIPSTAEAICWLTHMALKGGLRNRWETCLTPGGGPRQQQQQQEWQGGGASTPAGAGSVGDSKSSKGGQQQGLPEDTGYDNSCRNDTARSLSDVPGYVDKELSGRKGILLPDGLQISLCSVLGAGVCGRVYKGWWRSADGVTEVAVKGATMPHLQELLQHEVEIYQQLQELQGVSIPELLAHGPGLNGVGYFLVLQFLPGTGVSPSFHGEQPGIKDAAAAALGRVHAHGVLHGDVRPGNLIVQPGGQVWVIDFTHAEVSSQFGQHLGKMQVDEQRELAMLFVECRHRS